MLAPPDGDAERRRPDGAIPNAELSSDLARTT